MIRRTTWILLGFLVIAGIGYAVLRQMEAKAPAGEPAALTETLWNLIAEQVDSVRLVDPASSRLIVIGRDPQSGWRMSAPRRGEADAGRIEIALAGLLAPAVREALEDPGDLAAFGLAPPQARITVIMVDGTSRSLEVGSLDPTRSVYYVRLSEASEVEMVSRYSMDDLLGLIQDPPYPLPTSTPTGVAGETAIP